MSNLSSRKLVAPSPLRVVISGLEGGGSVSGGAAGASGGAGAGSVLAAAGMGAGDRKMFRSFFAEKCDDAVFPPRVGLAETRLPRLPLHKDGPAPVSFGASGAAGSAAAEMEHMWLAGFLDAQGGAGMDDRAPLKGKLPGYGTSAEAKRMLFRKKFNVVSASAEADAAAAATNDVLAASAEFKRLMKKLSELHFDDERKRMSLDAASKHKLSHNPMMQENRRIRRAILGGGVRRGPGDAAMMGMRATGLDKLLLLERVEVQAAIVLQRFWRRELRKRFWRRFALETRSATKLQGAYRGHMERKRIMRYFRACKKVARFTQAWWRGKQVRDRVKAEMQFVNGAAIDIQRVFRGLMARRGMLKRIQDRQILRLQAWWRGCLGRAKADRMWFDKRVTLIQSNVRRFLAQRKIGEMKKRYFRAATRIQAAARAWLARRERDKELWDKESYERKRVMLMLMAHSRYLEIAADNMVKEAAIDGFEEKLMTLALQWESACQGMPDLELNFLSQERDFGLLDQPSDAASKVIFEQSEKAMIDARAAVTEAKVNALFHTALQFRQMKLDKARQDERLEDMLVSGA